MPSVAFERGLSPTVVEERFVDCIMAGSRDPNLVASAKHGEDY